MKDKNKVFFGENGITSTSANHIANIAKEYVQHIKDENAAISFLDCKVSLISSQDSKIIAHGVKSDILQQIPTKLQQIIVANSLIAWLREAIKAKEEEIKAVSDLTLEDYLDSIGIEWPVRPDKRDYGFVEFDDVLAALSIKEREEYYSLETKCSTIGIFIHSTGGFSKARKEFQERITQPITVQGEGQNTMVYEYTPSIDTKEVEDMFFNLQNEYRGAQAALNAIKFKIDQQVNQINQQENNKLSVDTNTYINTHKKLEIDLNAYKEEKKAELSKLKIVIPNSHNGIFEMLNNIGK